MQDDLEKTPPPVVDASPPVMPAETKTPGNPAPGNPAPSNPAWASDLRELYNSVVEEKLPDSFIALLSQLDPED